MKVVAIVQARMTSTRLPGKVLEDLGGRPVLEWVLRRLAECGSLDEVAVAATSNATDDPIALLATRLGVSCTRGPEADVLERYRMCADASGADVVVRVTSDCPLIDPDVVDLVVGALDTAADYASNTLRRTWPRGLDCEVFTMAALRRTAAEAHSAEAREHVTWFMHTECSAGFSLRSVESPVTHADLRWTLDTPEDLRMLRVLVAATGTDAYAARYARLLATIESNPSIAAINSAVQQRA